MKVKITLLEEVLGSSPSNDELLATYIASKAPTGDLTAEEVDNIKAQNAEDRITVFPKTADGTPFLYDYQVKGMFKDSCKMLAKAGKAGDSGAATAGDSGAATSRGSVSVGENGCGLVRGENVKIKGGMGAILVIAVENDEDYGIKEWKAFVVDGENIKPDTWYKLKNGGLVEVSE